jgi:hypothetical protein
LNLERRALLWEREGLDGMRKDMGERRLGWNEEGDKQGYVYIGGGHLAARVKILSLMAPYEGICEWIGKIRDLIVEECRKNERIDER